MPDRISETLKALKHIAAPRLKVSAFAVAVQQGAEAIVLNLKEPIRMRKRFFAPRERHCLKWNAGH
jgi:hypothetical protein